MLMGYIPSFSLFGDGDLTFVKDKSIAMMEVEALNLVGKPYEIKGVSKFRMQYNPNIIEDSASTAVYAQHRGLGSQVPTYHYTYSETGPITIPVICTDSYDGPPHSTRSTTSGLLSGLLGQATGGVLGGTTSEIVYKDFENLLDVTNWFRNLTHPVDIYKKPPFVRVSFGKWNRFGVVTEVTSPRFLSFYKNGDPRIVELSFTLVPDVMVIAGDKSFYEID